MIISSENINSTSKLMIKRILDLQYKHISKFFLTAEKIIFCWSICKWHSINIKSFNACRIPALKIFKKKNRSRSNHLAIVEMRSYWVWIRYTIKVVRMVTAKLWLKGLLRRDVMFKFDMIFLPFLINFLVMLLKAE
jgi:hypothetical protein